MDNQREIYRVSIVKWFKENFDSALFEEKCDDLMTDDDFASIRDEIEEDYFIKNRGIAPYTKAINYLRNKIQACTTGNVLFASVEDFILTKKNISITLIPKSMFKTFIYMWFV